MIDLDGLMIEPLTNYANHTLLTRLGKTYPIHLEEEISYLIGEPMTDMGGFANPIPVTTPDRTPAPLLYTVHMEDAPRYSLRERRDDLEADLPNVGSLWRPDGLVMPLWYGQLAHSLAREEGFFDLALMPKAYEPINPVLDAAQYFNNTPIFRAHQHKKAVPILRFDVGSGLTFFLGPTRLRRGSVNFATYIRSRGVHDLFRIGAASEDASTDKLSARYNDQEFVFDLWGRRVVIPEDDGPGFSNLHAWSILWVEGSHVALVLTTPTQTKVWGPYPLGQMTDLIESTVTVGELAGFYMPGSSSYRVPFVSLHPMSVSEVTPRARDWLRALAAFPDFTVPAPPWGLDMSVRPTASEVTAGKTATLTVVLTPSGGVPSSTLYTLDVSTDEPGLTFEVGAPSYSVGSGDDAQAVTRVTFAVTVRASEEVSEGAHELTLKGRAANWVDDETHPYYNVQDSEKLSITAHLFDAEVAPNALAVNQVLALPAWTKDNFLKDSSSGATRALAISGRVIPTTRGDGLRSSGKVGAAIRGSALGKRLGDGVEVAAYFANPSEIPSGAVVLSLASTTRKQDWCYAYKTTGGFKIRTSWQQADGSSLQADSALLATGEGSRLALLTTSTQVVLWDVGTGAVMSTSNPGWPLVNGDDCRPSYLCLYLSDNTVSLPALGTLLSTTVHPSSLSALRRDRNMRFIVDTYARRRAQDVRPELPLSTLGYFEINDGEMLKDRAFQASDLQLVGTVTQDATNGRLSTSGSGNNAIWTGWLSGITWGGSFTFVALINDWESQVGTRPLGLSSEDVLTDWMSVRKLSYTSNGKLIIDCYVECGDTGVFSQDHVRMPASPKKAFVFSFAKAPSTDTTKAGVLTIRELFNGVLVKTANVPKDWVGRVALCAGAVYRGKTSPTGSVSGVFQPASVNLEGVWFGDEVATDTQLQAVLDNLNGTYPKLPPVLVDPTPDPDPNPDPEPDPDPDPDPNPDPGNQPGTPAPIDVSGSSIIPRLTIGVDTSTPAFPTQYGTDWYNLYKTAEPNWNTASDPAVPYDFRGNTDELMAKMRQSETGLTDAQKTALRAEKAAIQAKYAETGQYQIARPTTTQTGQAVMSVRLTKKKWGADKAYNLLNHAISTLCWRGSPQNMKKASELDSSRTDYLGHLYGGDANGPTTNLGTRQVLEDGVKCKGLLEGAYLLWSLRSLDTRYLPLVYKVLAYYKYHLKPDWEQYYRARGTWFKSGSTTERRYPITIRRGFAHADWSEAVAEAYLAKIETEMWLANLRTGVSVQLSGYDYAKANAGQPWNQFYGDNPNYRRTWTGTYQIDATTGVVTDHYGWKNGKAFISTWKDSKHVMHVPASQINDTSKRTPYPLGIIDWAQNTGVNLFGVWAQPTVYHTETDCHVLSAYLIGLLADVFGSLANCHEWLKKVAGARHCGSGVRDDGTLTYDGLGFRTTTSVADPSSSNPNRRRYSTARAYSGTLKLTSSGDDGTRYEPTTNAVAHQYTGLSHLLALGGFNNVDSGAKAFLTKMWGVQPSKSRVIGGQIAGMTADVIRDFVF